MTAVLVEHQEKAYAQLATIQPRFPDIEVKPYHADFISIVPNIVADIPRVAFAFFLIDPKGWDIPLLKLMPMLARPKSEVTFNFMFEFINRAASMSDADTVAALNELMPYGDWRQRWQRRRMPTSGRPFSSPPSQRTCSRSATTRMWCRPKY